MRVGALSLGPRSVAAASLAAGLALLAVFWISGGYGLLGAWALEQQRALQGSLGQHIQSIRAGQSAAFWALLALSAGYGFVHAVGPGHGKVLVGGAALGSATTARRMAIIALAGSLGQSVTAIVLVYGGFLLFQTTARAAVGLESALEPVGHLAVAAIGVWLVLRGARAARRGRPCACGHDHGPDPEAVARAGKLREAVALVAAMAARPCAGAVIVLVLAWRSGIPATGAAAVLAMGLGTAGFTVAVAAMTVSGRDAALLSAGPAAAARRLGPALQIVAGFMMLLVSTALLFASLDG